MGGSKSNKQQTTNANTTTTTTTTTNIAGDLGLTGDDAVALAHVIGSNVVDSQAIAASSFNQALASSSSLQLSALSSAKEVSAAASGIESSIDKLAPLGFIALLGVLLVVLK